MTLIVPRHYPREQGVRSAAPQRTVHATATDDFVSPDHIRSQIAEFRAYPGTVPAPRGWALMVLMLSMPEETSGGLIMEDQYRNQKSKASPQGVVIAVGDVAYNPKDDRFPTGPWCEAGDRVLYGRYTGKEFTLANGQVLAFLVDTDVIGVIDRGWLINQETHA